MHEEIIKEARTYLGVPWRHQGRSRSGVDCVGFILLALIKSGIKMKEIRGYARTPDGVALKKIMDEEPTTENIKLQDDIKVGDILLFRIRHHPQHVALVTNSNTDVKGLGMIHSFNGGEKRVVEHDLADYWKEKIVAIYRLK